MKPILFIITFLMTIPLMAQDDKPINVPQIAVKVGLNNTVNFDDVAITFLEVLEDSRCPKNVECIWAGEAKVLVRITSKNGDTKEETIVFKNGAAVVAEQFNIALQFLQLSPYPDANIPKNEQAPYTLLTRTVTQ